MTELETLESKLIRIGELAFEQGKLEQQGKPFEKECAEEEALIKEILELFAQTNGGQI